MADISGSIPSGVVDAIAVFVAAAIPVLTSRIPSAPAAELGRTGAPPAGSAVRLPRTPASQLAELILAALEPALAELDAQSVPDLGLYLSPPGPASGQGPRRSVVVGHRAGESKTVAAVSMLDQLRPGTSSLVAGLSRRLAGHQMIMPLLAVPPEASTEEAVAAAHGAAYLALAVATARAVADDFARMVAESLAAALGRAGQGRPPRLPIFDRDAGVVGLGLDAARTVLGEVPMPESYAAALLEKTRAEYQLPRGAYGKVSVTGHRFALLEGTWEGTAEGAPGDDAFPGEADFSGNGLVTVVPGGLVIRTGLAEGIVSVKVRVCAEPTPLRDAWWDEIVEVSWHAETGLASIIGLGGTDERDERADRSGRDERDGSRLRQVTPPWPGDYRLRVCASGRDEVEDTEDTGDGERYELEIWQAPPAPEVVHKRVDRLGHRLRGEPEPAPLPAPWREYRWISRTALGVHGTITIITGASVPDVLLAFGADPERPESLSALDSEAMENLSLREYSVGVLPVTASGGETAVIAFESAGFKGSDERTLARASANGRAASFHQNAKGMTTLSFAEGGRSLVSYEPFGPPDEDAGAAVAAAVEGLNFADVRDHAEKCLVAMEHFTGCGITLADLERIQSADVGYRVPVY